MPDLLSDEIRSWIGRSAPPIRLEVSRRDIIKYSIATEQTKKIHLDGDIAPPMFLFGTDKPLVSISDLAKDGLAKDVLTPPLPLKRVMAGGIRQKYYREIKAGDKLLIQKKIVDIYQKEGRSGPLIFVVYNISIQDENENVVMEITQSRINR